MLCNQDTRFSLLSSFVASMLSVDLICFIQYNYSILWPMIAMPCLASSLLAR
uniref:Uncharacterized protein n=1 Tax=Rhizophora mucronata TaxID=61149 RepID=A0A2P2PFZ6_RHIMU